MADPRRQKPDKFVYRLKIGGDQNRIGWPIRNLKLLSIDLEICDMDRFVRKKFNLEFVLNQKKGATFLNSKFGNEFDSEYEARKVGISGLVWRLRSQLVNQNRREN